MRAWSLRVSLLAIVAFVAISSGAFAARIDATKGRRYELGKKHGPWMIMVASLSTPPKERQKKDGLSAQEAADLLVYELRTRGIPAYTFKLDSIKGAMQIEDRKGRQANRIFRAQEGGVCVLAGNYKNLNDRIAQKTLTWIKSYKPKLWGDRAFYGSTPGQRGPLSGAFLTINPSLSPEEFASKKRDPILLRLNGNDEHSILNNTGKYTLVIGTFSGRSQVAFGSKFDAVSKNFKVKGTLDDAANRAWKVSKLLRDGSFQGQQRGRKFDAYVFHDRYKSMVTIGAFDSPNDPRIAQYSRLFGAKVHPGTNGRPYMTGESIVVPGNKPETIIFDPKPRLIEVPKIR
jgi:hypothetical protein